MNGVAPAPIKRRCAMSLLASLIFTTPAGSALASGSTGRPS